MEGATAAVTSVSTTASSEYVAVDNEAATTATATTTTSVVRHCLVCYSDLTHTAVTSCQHNEICGVCHLRLRHLHKDRRCPICKTTQEKIVVDKAPGKPRFQDYPIWGNELGASFVFREDCGMFFEVEYYHQVIEPLFGYHCTVPKCTYDGTTPDPNINNNNNNNKPPPTALRALQDHLRQQHRLALCNLCVTHQRDFVARLRRFTPAQLQKHLQSGDGKSSGFTGHPVCEFCRPTRFYDITALHQHLAKDHYKCHVCEQHLGLPNQYFKHYQSLEKHFDRDHFLCRDPQCLTARFVVFGNELDLRAHERTVHGGTHTNDNNNYNRLQLEFRVARRPGATQQQHHHYDDDNNNNNEAAAAPSERDFNYNLDGQPFVPADMPQSNAGHPNNLAAPALHPLHMQRTLEIQQQAAALRREDDNQRRPDAFPSLQQSGQNNSSAGDANYNNNLRMGWASEDTVQRIAHRNAGAVTDQDFPSLQPSAAATRSKKQHTATRSGTSRHFAAMNLAANNSSTSSWSGATAAASAPPQTTTQAFLAPSAPSRGSNNAANLSSDNFPSLGVPSSQQPHRYKAVDALVRRNNNAAVNNLTADMFPSLGAPSAAANRRIRNAPPLQRPHTASANVLQVPAKHPNRNHVPTTTTTTALEEIKTSMGSTQYKKLRGYTKDFAAGDLEPDAYVDHAASLFERGYADSDFWRFLPSLIDSCPSQSSADQAKRYLDNLWRMRNGAMNAEASRNNSTTTPAAKTTSSSSWSSSSGPSMVAASLSAPPLQQNHHPSGWSSSTSAATRRTGAATPAQSSSSSFTVPGKKKNAWGSSSGASTVVRAKAPPGSVAVAAAALATPQSGTATKYMAQQQQQQRKQQQAKQQQQSNNKKKKKKKQNDELRQLAFGSG